MYKLLIVDDEYEIRTGLCNYFPWSETGFEAVGQAENGKQALELIKKQHIDAVLCDIRMPIMSGIEFVQEIVRLNIKAKVIFLSGHKDFEYVRQALLFGAKDYILKPTQYEQLREVFSKLKTELDAEMISSGHEAETKGNTFSQKVIEIIKNYIEEHYKDVRLDELAQLVQMNPFYLSKFFKEKTGQNFSDYLIQIKMEKAAQFLQDIRYKTYEVSSMVGYSEPKSFTRTFKRFYGISPREFRRSET